LTRYLAIAGSKRMHACKADGITVNLPRSAMRKAATPMTTPVPRASPAMMVSTKAVAVVGPITEPQVDAKRRRHIARHQKWRRLHIDGGSAVCWLNESAIGQGDRGGHCQWRRRVHGTSAKQTQGREGRQAEAEWNSQAYDNVGAGKRRHDDLRERDARRVIVLRTKIAASTLTDFYSVPDRTGRLSVRTRAPRERPACVPPGRRRRGSRYRNSTATLAHRRA
jgi:hypothetical protein